MEVWGRQDLRPPADPTRVMTRRDFARELTLARQRVGLTVRDIAKVIDVPTSTVGGYFGGAHLPAARSASVLDRILQVCGVTDTAEVGQWRQAARRALRRPARPAADVRTDAVAGRGTPASRHTGHGGPDWCLPAPALVSIRPPVQRLAAAPRLRGRGDLLGLLTASLLTTGLAGSAEPVEAVGPVPTLGPGEPVQPLPPARVHVLYGLGGGGKTTVALALARQSLARGVRTWWVDAADAPRAQAGLQAVAVELGADPHQLRLGSAPDLLWRLLDAANRPWLLVIDGADDPQRILTLPGQRMTDAIGWLRPVTSPFGMVVVTTRDGSPLTWGQAEAGWWLRLHRVDPLPVAEASQMLYELAGQPAGSVESARRLAERLGGLPLGLRLAGTFLGEASRMPTGIRETAEVRTFDAFRAALDQGRHDELFQDDSLQSLPSQDERSADGLGEQDTVGLDVLGQAEDDRTGQPGANPVRHLLEPALGLLDARGLPEARALLALLSCFAPAPIPYAMLLSVRILARSPLFTGLTGRRLWSVLQALAYAGLVDLRHDGTAPPDAADTLVLPPLVRDTMRRHGPVSHHLYRYETVALAVLTAAARQLDPTDSGSRQRWRLLAEHCSSPLGLLREQPGRVRDAPPDVLAPAIEAGRYLCAAGHLSRAASEYSSLMLTGRGVLGREHPQMLTLHHELCQVWFHAGRYTWAKRGFHEVVEARRRVLGGRHPATLSTVDSLGRTLFEHGQLADAHRLLATALDQRRAVLGADHPDTLGSMTHLAEVLRAQGRRAEAQTLLRQVHRAQLGRLGDGHPATLRTRHHLAAIAADCGELGPAEAELRRVWTALRQALHAKHPWVLAAQQSLADACHERGQLDEAERLVHQVLASRQRMLGYDHPYTLTTRHRLGLVLIDRGDPQGAEKELQSVLEVRRRVLAVHHGDTARTADCLAALRRRRPPG